MNSIYKYTLLFFAFSAVSLKADQEIEKVKAAVEVKETDLASGVNKDLQVKESPKKAETKKPTEKKIPSLPNLMAIELAF